MTDKSKKTGNGKLVRGIIYLVISLAIFLWAREHSPNMGLDEMLTKPMDTYILKPDIYNGILIACAAFGLLGAITVVRGLQEGQKKSSGEAA